jgi:hypothetical protein
MEATLHLRQRGTLTLPVELRDEYDIREGAIFHLLDLNGIFVLVPRMPLLPNLARDIEQARRKNGLSMNTMLKNLRKQRREYHQAKYKRGKKNE